MPMDRGVKRLAVTNECVADGPKEAMQIWVMTTKAREITLDVKADGSDTIENIKAQIETKAHIPVYRQTLWFDQRMLQNNWNLSSCGIQEGAILVLSEKGVIMHVQLTFAGTPSILSVDTHEHMIVVMQKLQDITDIPIGNIAIEVHKEGLPAALLHNVPLIK
jgi:hypothetical protein